MPTHVYFDMDGVLVHFDEEHAVTRPFMVPGSRYFRRCLPDDRAVAIMEALHGTPGCDVGILTRIFDVQSLAGEWAEDKTAWARRYCEFLRNPPIIVSTPDKNDVLAGVPASERAKHILVDDDPRILRAWTEYGGTGVLYVQRHRERPPGWTGAVISKDMTARRAVETILDSAADARTKRRPT